MFRIEETGKVAVYTLEVMRKYSQDSNQISLDGQQ